MLVFCLLTVYSILIKMCYAVTRPRVYCQDLCTYIFPLWVATIFKQSTFYIFQKRNRQTLVQTEVCFSENATTYVLEGRVLFCENNNYNSITVIPYAGVCKGMQF